MKHCKLYNLKQTHTYYKKQGNNPLCCILQSRIVHNQILSSTRTYLLKLSLTVPWLSEILAGLFTAVLGVAGNFLRVDNLEVRGCWDVAVWDFPGNPNRLDCCVDDACLPRLVLAFALPLTPLTSVVELAKVCWRLWKPAVAVLSSHKKRIQCLQYIFPCNT